MRGFESKAHPTQVNLMGVPGLENGAHEIDGNLSHMDVTGLTCDIDGVRWFIPRESVRCVYQVQTPPHIPEDAIEKGTPRPPKKKDED